jgi:hypothetical protein
LDSTFPAAGSTKVSSKSALLLIGAKEKSGSGHVAVGLRTVMSEANLAVVREIYRAFAEHRFPAEYLADEFAWETAPEIPGAGTYSGHEAVRAYFRDWVGGWQQVASTSSG